MAAIPQDPRQNPPWAGSSDTMKVVANTRQPLKHDNDSRLMQGQPSSFPIKDAENPNMYPPICIRSHWDAEMIIRRTLPQGPIVASPLDPRPWTKVCLTYTTSADFEDAPRPPDYMVFPSGGAVYPPTRYRDSIDNESRLRRLDRPLGTCERDQYIPPRTGDMYRANATVPDRPHVSNRFVDELSFPKACIRSGPYDCRVEAEQEAWARSPRLFNNTTKQDRYAASRPDLAKPKSTMAPQPTGMVPYA